jgi:hypothetical protein
MYNFNKTIEAGNSFYKPLTDNEIKCMNNYEKMLAERANELIRFCFGGECEQRDGTIVKIKAGIKSFRPKIYDFVIPNEEILIEIKSTTLKRLCLMLGVMKEEELFEIISVNPGMGEKCFNQIPYIYNHLSDWENSISGLWLE